MDIELIFALIDKAQSSCFDTIEIQTQELRLCLSRNPRAEGALTADAAGAQPNEDKSDKAEEAAIAKDNAVFTPISGVFYARKDPSSEPYVCPGSRVVKGQPLCIVEAMKMMNEICAPKAGVIERVLVADAEPVIAGDALFVFAKEG
jgi:acetyl-CoA carboxylase biotin carboxyl carrier protein